MQNRLKISDPTKIVTLANIISLFRAVLAVPIVYTLRDPSLGSITLLLILIAILSDALDGWVARKADEVTYFGQWVDPISDFICILSMTESIHCTSATSAFFDIHAFDNRLTLVTYHSYLLSLIYLIPIFRPNSQVVFPVKLVCREINNKYNKRYYF